VCISKRKRTYDGLKTNNEAHWSNYKIEKNRIPKERPTRQN
jgi:hypothetical protein